MMLIYALIDRREDNKIAVCKTAREEVAKLICEKLTKGYSFDYRDCIDSFHYIHEDDLSVLLESEFNKHLRHPEDWQKDIKQTAKKHEREILNTIKIRSKRQGLKNTDRNPDDIFFKLDKKDLDILRLLCDKYPGRLSVMDIFERIKPAISDTTIKLRLRKLIDLSVVNRDAGPRSGAGISKQAYDRMASIKTSQQQ